MYYDITAIPWFYSYTYTGFIFCRNYFRNYRMKNHNLKSTLEVQVKIF